MNQSRVQTNQEQAHSCSLQLCFRQQFLKPPELLRRYPDTAPDPGYMEIAVVQKAIDGSCRDAKIERHLLHPVIALRWWLALLPGFLWSISLVCHHEKRSSLGHGFWGCKPPGRRFTRPDPIGVLRPPVSA